MCPGAAQVAGFAAGPGQGGTDMEFAEFAEIFPVIEGEDELRWQDQAACLGMDPDLFFPERGASTREAKSICRSCVVREDCLEFALRNGEKFGIWGGMSERERRRVRRMRALARRRLTA